MRDHLPSSTQTKTISRWLHKEFSGSSSLAFFYQGRKGTLEHEREMQELQKLQARLESRVRALTEHEDHAKIDESLRKHLNKNAKSGLAICLGFALSFLPLRNDSAAKGKAQQYCKANVSKGNIYIYE